jgi:hypothetical protein
METVACLDGSRAEYTEKCITTTDGKCSYYYRKCPVPIRLIMSTGNFTIDDLKDFLALYRISLDDVKYEIKGSEITLYVDSSVIPEGKKDEDVAKDIAASATANPNNQGTAYVLSGAGTGTTGNFGNVVVVSVIGMIFALFM